MSSAERPGRMNSSVGGCGGGEVDGVRSDTVIIRRSYGRSRWAYLLYGRLASLDSLRRECWHCCQRQS